LQQTPRATSERPIAPDAAEPLAPKLRRGLSGALRDNRERVMINLARLAVLAVLVLFWEYVPQLMASKKLVILNPLFISSPSRIARDLYDIASTGLVLKALWSTVSASLIGLAVGVSAGYIVALILGESRRLADVFMVYIDAINAVPRVALFPLIVILVGFGPASKIISAIIVVFFIIFYNAYQGTRSVPAETVSAYTILGAGRWFLIRYLKAYVALGWAVAQFPTAIAFSLVAVITTEILVSNSGLGYLLISALDLLNSTRAFSIMVVAAATGIILSGGARFVVRKIFPWIDVVT
jgi:NitT/TauT family transport system permease protein